MGGGKNTQTQLWQESTEIPQVASDQNLSQGDGESE